MVQQRTDVKQTETYEEQLSREAAQFNPPSRRYDRESHLQRVEQVETASNIQKWLSSKICGKAC
jgi:hypothetical protein